MKILFIVESPTKANTIKKLLDDIDGNNEYIVKATLGHVRDLDKKGLGVDLSTFECTYTLLDGRKKLLQGLKTEMKGCESVYIASDNDREGEIIAWHLMEVLQPKCYKRVTFNEVTADGLKLALANLHDIRPNIVNSQMTRRIIDRIVGYNFSPLLGREFDVSMSKISSGRVQSACLKLLVDREQKREAMVNEPVTYKAYAKLDIGLARLLTVYCNNIDNFETVLNNKWSIKHIESKRRKLIPNAPFTTSTLQQEAYKRLGFSIETTMTLAQNLYEIGAITYIRTTSSAISEHGKTLIQKQLGSNFHVEKTGSLKIGAHEAIRPTFKNLDMNSDKHVKLYDLIMKRTLDAFGSVKISTDLHITLQVGEGTDVWVGTYENCKSIPTKVDSIIEIGLKGTSPVPSRFNEGSLVKELEDMGIGTPSTFVSTISKLLKHGFIVKEEEAPLNLDMVWDIESSKMVKLPKKGRKGKELVPTVMGVKTIEFLSEHFNEIIDVGFTKTLEARLDQIEHGMVEYKDILQEFLLRFSKHLNMVPQSGHVKTFSDTKTSVASFVYFINDKKYIVRSTRYGPVIEKEEKQFISLQGFLTITGKQIEHVSKSDVAFLTSFPKPTNDRKHIVNYGRYGFYVSSENNATNTSVPKSWYAENSIYDITNYTLEADTIGSM